MANYCSVSDLYTFGLPRGGLPNPSRMVHSVSSGGNTITLDEHGFSTGDEMSFRPDGVDGVLPSPLTEGTTYYAIAIDDARFSVSATLGGAAVDLTTNGERVHVIERIPYDATIAWASRIVDDHIPAHIVPLAEPYPEVIRMTTAELAATKLMGRQGSVQKSLSDVLTLAQKRIERWAKGVPVRGPNSPARANLATSSASAAYLDRAGWRTPGTI